MVVVPPLWGVGILVRLCFLVERVRVVVPWVQPAMTQQSLVVSASLWSLAFALYLAGNIRPLITPRPDGMPG